MQGDWGDSFRTQRPVADMVGEATWNTFLLVGTALVLSVLLALVIGVVSAVRQYSAFDYAATSFSYFGFSMPDFFFALLLQLFVVLVLHEQLGIDVLYVQGKYSVGERGQPRQPARAHGVAGHGAHAHERRGVEPLPARQHARGAPHRLRAHGARQGCAPPPGDSAPRACGTR